MKDQEMVRAEALKTEVQRRLTGVDGVVGVGIEVGGVRVLVRDTASIDRVIVALQRDGPFPLVVTIEVVGEIRAGGETT